MNEYRLSIIIPCFGRPARTRRIINNVLSQNINNWEAFIIGDGCPKYQTMIQSGEIEFFTELASKNGNKLHMFNFNENKKGYGYFVTNYATKNAKGKYIIYAGNDDILFKDHFEHYLSEIENTDFDMVCYNTFVGPEKRVRKPMLLKNHIGHSEIIVKTDLIRDYEHSPNYTHDWGLIDYIMNKTKKIHISTSDKYTYVVTHMPNFSIDIID